jgi:hypothetical protein
MTSATMMERTGMAMPGMGMQGVGAAPVTPGAGMSYFMVPRCTYKVERTADGMKVWCTCDDDRAGSTLQHLCEALAGGMCSCTVTCNGMPVCTYHFTMGMCRWEMTDKGVCFSCTSGDAQCSKMIQAFCDCLSAMMAAGCHCCLSVSNTPVCCGSSEPAAAPVSGKSKK